MAVIFQSVEVENDIIVSFSFESKMILSSVGEVIDKKCSSGAGSCLLPSLQECRNDVKITHNRTLTAVFIENAKYPATLWVYVIKESVSHISFIL